MRLAASLLSFMMAPVMAQHSFHGELVDVLTPDTVRVKVSDSEHLDLSIRGPMFKDIKNQTCNVSAARAKCNLLREMLEDKSLGIIVEVVKENQMLGDIIVDDKALSIELVRQGHYRFDWQQSRDEHLIIAEREAYCHYRGLWAKHRGDHEHAAKCQQR